MKVRKLIILSQQRKKMQETKTNIEVKKQPKAEDEYEIKYSDLKFINKNQDRASPEDRLDLIDFETKNLAHCFSRKVTFKQLLGGLPLEEIKNFKIDDYSIESFMHGDSETGKCMNQIFCDIPLDVHFVIKHENSGKIESHLWFFKGFCNKINPEFAFIIDAGTIALWNSISRLIFHMERFKNIGGA